MAELAGSGRKTKRFRVAREGQTIDGRTLQRQDLQEMADSYDPEQYGARINVEHLRGYSPEPPFNAYGDILLVEAVEEGGRLCLYNTISALPNMLAILDKGQKIYPSIEYIRDFAGNGKAYQVGLGLTDNPASLGTEPLKFHAHGQVIRTVPDKEIFIMSQPQNQPQTFASKISALLSGFVATTPAATTVPAVTPTPAAQPTADQQFQAATFEGFSKLINQQGQMAQAIQLLSTKLDGMQPAATTPTTQPVATSVSQPATVPVQQHAAQQPTVQVAQPNPAPTVAEPVTLEQLMANIANIAQGQQNLAATLQQLGATPQSNSAPTATGGTGLRNEF